MIRWLGLLVGVALVAGCGTVVQEFTASDLRAAQARAEQSSDTAGAACWKALADELDSQAGALSGKPAGLVDAYELARLLHQKTQAGVPSVVKAGCAEVAVDLLMFLAKVGLAAVPGGGLIPFGFPLR